MKELKIKASEVRGFNYHPSYSTDAMCDWLFFDEEIWRKELTTGKKAFPKMNTVRLWLSWAAYCRLEGKFIEHIQKAIEICKELGIYVIPCLFNRWHDPMVNGDSIYIDHFLPNSSWLHKFGNLFEDYIDALCDAFRDEEQILVWDICNEPFAYNGDFPAKDIVKQYELDWLKRMCARVRANGVTQPIGIGSTGMEGKNGLEGMDCFNEMCDVYLTHLYYIGNDIAGFERKVAYFANEAKMHDKPIITSECCWGSLDDQKRAELIRGALTVFKKYGVGFVAHALWYCGCADLHDPCDGRVTPNIGNLCFINKDGSIRPHHQVFNEF